MLDLPEGVGGDWVGKGRGHGQQGRLMQVEELFVEKLQLEKIKEKNKRTDSVDMIYPRIYKHITDHMMLMSYVLCLIG